MLFLVLLSSLTLLCGSTIWSSNFDIDTTLESAGNPHIMITALVVLDGITLTLDPGVVFELCSGCSLRVDGDLVVNGIDNDPVLLTSYEGRWASVVLNGMVSINNGIFEHGGSNGEGLLEVKGITDYGVPLVIEDSMFLNSTASGIKNTGINDIEIRNCTFRDISIGSVLYAIYSSTAVKIEIYDSVFVGMEGGFIYDDNGKNWIIEGNEFRNSTASSKNFFFDQADWLEFRNNEISDSTAYLYMTWGLSGSVVFSGNTFERCSGDQDRIIHTWFIGDTDFVNNVFRNCQGGIYIDGHTTQTKSQFVGNVFEDNYIQGSYPMIRIELEYDYNNFFNMTGNTFVRNSAPYSNSLIYFYNLDISPIDTTLFYDNNLTDNVASKSVLLVKSNNMEFRHNIFSNPDTTYEMEVSEGVSSPLDATENWWGFTERDSISEKIYDFFFDSSLSVVEFSPFIFQYFNTTALKYDSPPGIITSDVTWTLVGSPYYITESVYVSSTGSLTIEPGVVVIFSKGVGISCLGGLSAIGQVGNPITFRGDGTHYWGTISLFSYSAPISHCVFEEAETFLSLFVSSGQPVEVLNCTFHNGTSESIINECQIEIRIKNCSFHDIVKESTSAYAIDSSSSSETVVIEDCEFVGVGGGFFSTYDGKDCVIQRSVFRNSSAISRMFSWPNVDQFIFRDNYVYDSSGNFFADWGAWGDVVDISNNHFEGNLGDSSGRILYVWFVGGLTFHNNVFKNNKGWFYLDDHTTKFEVKFTENVFEGNFVDGNPLIDIPSNYDYDHHFNISHNLFLNNVIQGCNHMINLENVDPSPSENSMIVWNNFTNNIADRSVLFVNSDPVVVNYNIWSSDIFLGV